MQTLQLHIGGMACSFCAQSIDKAFTGREGIEKVSMSLAHERVLFHYDPKKIRESEIKKSSCNWAIPSGIRTRSKLLKSSNRSWILTGTAYLWLPDSPFWHS